jgi:uncharacterized membrane protein
MLFPVWFGIIYLCCVIVFMGLLAHAFRTYQGRTDPAKFPRYMQNLPPSATYTTNYAPLNPQAYSIRTRMISGLGNWLYPSAPYFNAAVILIGCSSFILGGYVWITLAAEFSGSWLVGLGGIGFEMGCIGLVFLGIYTENRHFKHGIVAGIAFGGYFAALLFWLIPIARSVIFPSWLVILHILPWLFMIYHAYAIRGFNLHEQMQDLLIIPWYKNYNLSEWLLFAGVCVWMLALYGVGWIL